MLLIGLAGADRDSRDDVAAQLADAGLCHVSTYANYATEREAARSPGRRVAQINALVSVTPPKGTDCLVFTQVLALEEAEHLRELGAQIWHVEGLPSCEVPMRRDDLKVTATRGGHRHYLDAVEALSEVMIAQAQGAA